MSNKKLLIAGSIGILLAISTAYALLGECQPYGDIIYNDRPVEDGLSVQALIGDRVYARSTTAGGGYSIVIPQDNRDTPEKDGWAAGDLITIKINDRVATPVFEAFVGCQRHDLRITTLGVKLDTWGKIKALFK
jgi:hypothetical protein